MRTESFAMETTIVTSEDGAHTFEIKRTWENGEKGKAIVTELYPTLDLEHKENFDLSTMHLINHVKELGWSEVRIINLFSKVFTYKPSSQRLAIDIENQAYIEEILEEAEIKEYDIVICWGSTLQQNKATQEMKKEILTMIESKGLAKQTKEITVDTFITSQGLSPHPLYLGLRHAKERWLLQEFDITAELKKLTKDEKSKNSKKKTERKKKQVTEQEVTADE